MGNRANIAIKQNILSYSGEDVFIYFYTHWNGQNLPLILQNALIRGKSRWEDDAYLNRIIFSEMIKNSILEETGYGISLEIQDNNYPIIYVDHKTKTVSIDDKSWHFDNYITTKF